LERILRWSAVGLCVGFIAIQFVPVTTAPRIADAHRGDGKRFVVRADEKLTAFLELESAINRLPQDEILKPCNAAAL
jgi:hypothetical protein